MNKLLEYCLAALLILECNSTYIRISSFSGIFSIFTAFIIFILCIQNVKRKNNLDYNKIVPFYFFYFLGSLIVFFKANPEFRISYISKFIMILPLLILYIASYEKGKSRFDLLYKIENLILIEACISIFFFLFGTLLSIIPSTETVYLNWGEGHFVSGWYHLYFEAQIFRNSGIFAEAPMHNYILCIAFLTEIYIKRNISKLKITILTIAILSTLSTTGQLVLISTLIIQLLTRNKTKRINVKIKILMYTISLGIIIGLYYLLQYILEIKSDTSSYEVRSNYIQTAIKNWQSSPIFGCGYGTNILGSSNSIFVLLAEGGLFMFSLYSLSLIYIPLLYWLKKINRKYTYFHLIYWGMFCITIILYCNITLFLLAIPLASFLKLSTKITETNNTKNIWRKYYQ